MGIRFYCPNGHKLNVKSFLAGKRGICPQCSARFRIPDESQIPKNAPKFRPPDSAATPESDTSNIPHSAAGTQTRNSSPTTGVASPVAAMDPIAEAPQAVWYVRPPSGGQYGPAQGDVMQRWIAEGRVSEDTLVWREGWADWQVAGPLFPSLSNDRSSVNAPNDEATEIRVEPEEEANYSRRPSSPRANPARARKKSVAAVVTLTVVIFVLLGVLIVVIQRM